MNEPTASNKLINLIGQANTLEKFLLFMVAGLTVAVVVLGLYVSSQGNKIDQLQVGYSGAPANTPAGSSNNTPTDAPSGSIPYHVHDYATSTHEHSQSNSYSQSTSLHDHPYADKDHTHNSRATNCDGTTDEARIFLSQEFHWKAFREHTHQFNC